MRAAAQIGQRQLLPKAARGGKPDIPDEMPPPPFERVEAGSTDVNRPSRLPESLSP